MSEWYIRTMRELEATKQRALKFGREQDEFHNKLVETLDHIRKNNESMKKLYQYRAEEKLNEKV